MLCSQLQLSWNSKVLLAVCVLHLFVALQTPSAEMPQTSLQGDNQHVSRVNMALTASLKVYSHGAEVKA